MSKIPVLPFQPRPCCSKCGADCASSRRYEAALDVLVMRCACGFRWASETHDAPKPGASWRLDPSTPSRTVDLADLTGDDDDDA